MRCPAWSLALGLLLALVACARHPTCSACHRQECRNMTLHIVRADGSTERTCCARCGVHVLGTGARPTSITVRDFDTGRPLPVDRAVFVEGSDVHPCRGTVTAPPRDEHGCCLAPAYDRCEPSLVAFASADAARAFMSVHGGAVTRWSELTRGVAGAS